MAPVSDTQTFEKESEESKVEGWRLHVLLEAGYPQPDAEALALRTDVDLHHACELLVAGCKLDVAMKILL